MDTPSDSQNLAKKDQQNDENAPRGPKTLKTLYLIVYNSISALLWYIVLVRVVATIALRGTDSVHNRVGQYTKWVQTLAGLEILHSLIGLVRAPLLTTIMQVASRFLLVWGVANNFPASVAQSFAYSTMLLAWSTTEVIRYSYFQLYLAFGSVPPALTWLRYNTFFVLYPIGICSECWLVWLARGPAGRRIGPLAEWALDLVLVIYIPGAYILFTHMMAQRRKIMRGSDGKKSK